MDSNSDDLDLGGRLMVDEPTTSELSRRVDALTDEVRTMGRGLNERLDRMPTSELLTAYLAKTDADVAVVKEDVAEIRADLAGFKVWVREEFAALEKRITEGKRWAIGALISSGGLLVAVVGLIRSFAS
ncbi:hypothetical protein [Pimelobacter simplex]|uniref:hypothetical protein n=1 Tax=Nocardioides simplex TaxID=2045 RepID=UPI003AAD495C